MNSSDERRDEGAPIVDPREVDARYRPFPSFKEWSAKSVVDTRRWERNANIIRELKESSPDLLVRALEIVKRAAAWDTGAIEGLYETNYGFTLTVAMEVAALETLVAQKGEEAVRLFESQLKAYDYVLDFATQRIPVAEAWIRELHKVVCESQDTYEVQTPIGTQRHPLPKREYKRNPNHVVLRDGSIHAWAPVDLTSQEMHRLCEDLRSEYFSVAHPILQAAYAHYAFVSIHPFADGNGRVARAPASTYTYRAFSVPVLLMVDNRRAYVSALTQADAGNYQPFVDTILERTLDAIRLVSVSLRSAALPQLEGSVDKLSKVYLTKGGFTQASIDAAGHHFFTLVRDEITRLATAAAEAGTFSFANYDTDEVKLAQKAGYRSPSAPQSWSFKLTSAPPTSFQMECQFALEVPKDCDHEDPVIIRWVNRGEELQASVTELMPVPTTALQMRISIWVRGVLGWTIDQLSRHAAELQA